MDSVEFFHSKNPEAPGEYCAFAAMLYTTLLWKDAFEYGVKIVNFYSSFSFLFPNGTITIASKTIHSSTTALPCYVCNINGSSNDFICFGLTQLSTWLGNNWDSLMEDDKK